MILILLLGICLSTQPSYAKVSYGGGFDNLNVAPVFLISTHDIFNSTQNGANPFKTTKQAEFADIVHKAIVKSDIVIILSENSLCVEDISSKDDKGTLFPNLRKIFLKKNSRYFPSVQDPYSILEQMLVPVHTNILYIREVDAHLQIPIDQNKHFYVFFEDGANETRSSVLRRHDAILSDVWNIAATTTKQARAVVVCAIYTGKASPTPKTKYRPRLLPTAKTDKSVLVVSEKARFVFGSVNLASPLRTRPMEGIPEVAEETWNHHKLSTRMAYSDIELEFNFLFRNADWELDNVRLLEDGEEVGRTVLRVGAPLRMSYVCGEPIVIVNTRDGSVISIGDYQIQPYRTEEVYYRVNKTNDTSCFGNSVHCGPYFTVAILSGLFVVGIMLGIVLMGITMLMNCHTNSRYDDANAKPFVVKST